MNHLKSSLFLIFVSLGTIFPQIALATPISKLKIIQKRISNLTPVHSWEELEEQRRQAPLGNETRQRRFDRDGGWRNFKRKHAQKIRRFRRNKGQDLSYEKSAYLYYNYNYGYLTDNCQFIKAPTRFCWFVNSGKKECEWRRKWQYSCY